MSTTIRTFRVPFGLAPDGSLVQPEGAHKEQPYACPACGMDLIFRAGSVRARHFAHRAGTGCTPETVLHATAKRAIVERVALWRAGRRTAPLTILTCARCGGRIERPCPDSITGAATEVVLPSGRRVDVALFAGDAVVEAIEVRVSHAVDEARTGDLSELPWIEVEAAAIIELPGLWRPIAAGGWPALVCDDCLTGPSRRWALLLDLAAEFAVEIPARPYWSQPHTCPSCRETTIVSTWPGQTFSRWHSRTPEPRPAWVVPDRPHGGYDNVWQES